LSRTKANRATSIQSAIHGLNLLSFDYEDFGRLVEPHTYGIDGKGHYAVRGYQIGGGSQSGESVGWKLFHVSEMRGLSVLPTKFAGPRPGYKRRDKAFRAILAEL